MFGFFMDRWYIILVLPALLISIWAQIKVKTTFSKFSNIKNINNITGYLTARKILDANGLYNVAIERTSGKLSDHYDPRNNVIRLSDEVFSNSSISAVGVAAHEAGHAIQYAKNYAPIKFRNAIIPITNIGSSLSMPLILLGLIFNGFDFLIYLGIILFSFVVFFQLVTLPVEFNASSRAISILNSQNILINDELKSAKKVLSAAALTYVAALLVSLAQLLRLVLIVANKRGKN